ncbi:MAG: TetR family transcriptional regulator [Eggerthellaceae bacterium]|nr:TetR family transcriptional regulator [Eggerthellaceae bacterium]
MDNEALSPDRLKIIANSEIKLSITSALDKLMAETDLDRVSVKSICDLAGVSRATFYRYFDDKFAVVEWYLHYINTKGVDRIGRSLSWYEGYFLSTALIHENIQFFLNASKSNDRNALTQVAPKARRETLLKTLSDVRNVEITDHLRFQVDAAVEVETRLFPAWHYGNYDCSLGEICHWMTECVPRELFELLDTPLKPQSITIPTM